MKRPPFVPSVVIPEEQRWGFTTLDVAAGLPHANPAINAASLPESRSPHPFRLLQYNVWFGSFENDRRMSYLGRVIEECQPDVICMQEVTDELLWHMGHSDWFRHYRRSHDRVEREVGYQEMIFSRTGFGSVNTGLFENSRMGRGWTIATVPVCVSPAGTGAPLSVCVGTSHLESLGGEVNSTLRGAQLSQCLHRVRGVSQRTTGGYRSVFAADTNMLPSDPDELLPAGWVDAWRALNMPMELDVCATYNGRMNPVVMGDVYVSRLDRIYVDAAATGGQGGITPRSCALVGTEAEGEVPSVVPSDHYGLLLECDIA